ncbi:hypothetical protein [Rubripirellula lacrimiformis]|uniref:hypothetical protein n=1 Tax=Rubripirellula lacrimiformis TaxID=1930273 RepID=UPI001C54D7D5|nr:hypothetical protein [Rubripirellula lacrimiformis]
MPVVSTTGTPREQPILFLPHGSPRKAAIKAAGKGVATPVQAPWTKVHGKELAPLRG